MTPLAAPRPAVFFLTRLPRPRIQEPLHLHPSLAKNPALGFSVSSLQAGRRRQRRRWKRGGWKAKWDDDAFEPPLAAAPPDIEAEIYEFMQQSASPADFPTKQELLAAGRADLVEAIATQGGWLTFGWDLEDEARASDDSAPPPVADGDGSHPATSTGSLMADFAAGPEDSERCLRGDQCTASSSGRSMEMEGGEGAGVEVILSRLEKERNLSYAAGLRKKKVNGQTSRRNGEHDPGDADVNGMRSSTADMWRAWSLQRAGFTASEFEAAEIVPNEDRKQLDQNLIPDNSTDGEMHKVAYDVTETGNRRNVPYTDAKKSSQNQIHIRLQHLESELKSALNLLRSKTNGVISHKVQESSLKELHRLSDAFEFQETEIMNARDKLRSTRAKLTVVEGKMALEIIEAQKILAEKQKRLDAAQKALRHLRSTCIVWPNTASEVLLAGSFDGWTSQRRMERSRTGIFLLYLNLYPGQYEIKFIVDGVWTVDLLRPIVRNKGHENNLLIIP